MPHKFEDILIHQNKTYDILFYDKLPFYIKFKIFSEGKILAITNKKQYMQIKRKFLHTYRDNYSFFKKNMMRMMANV